MNRPFIRQACSMLGSFAVALALLASTSAHAVVGRDWTRRNPLPSGDDINSVAASSSIAVAVGGHGLVLSSTDGITWTPRTSGTTATLKSIIFANSRFVAVGENSTAITSIDGITWTLSNMHDGTTGDTALEDFEAISHNGTQFIAAGSLATGTSGVVRAAPAGATNTWKKSVPAGSKALVSIATFGNNFFTIDSKSIYKGTSGVGGALSWAKLSPTGLPAGAELRSIAWNGGTLTMTGLDASFKTFVATNNLGIAWNVQTLPASFDSTLAKLKLSGSELIATGVGGSVWTSTNGTSWTDRSTGQEQTLYGATKLGTIYIATGQGGRIFTINPPGETVWSSRYSTGTTRDIAGVASNGSSFVAVGSGFSLTSTDGSTWTQHTLSNFPANSVAYTGTQYVAGGLAAAWTSTDGITWVEQTPDTFDNGAFNRMVWTGAALVGVGENNLLPAIQSSPDGITWTKATLPAGGKELRGLAFNAGLQVAVGDAGTVFTSPDFGLTWVKPKAPTTENFRDIAFGNGLFVACTDKGTLYSSANGALWVKRKTSPGESFTRIIYAGNQFLVIGYGGATAYSFGGTDWKDADIGASQKMTDLVWNGTKIAAVGDAGYITTSDGGQPVRPLVSFALATSNMPEAGPTASITLNLAPAAPLPVTVLYTLGGTATRGTSSTSDANPPVAAVVFAAGETSKVVTVPVKQDVLDEQDETIIFTLGRPTGDAGLGSQIVHTLTIVDDDQVPAFTTQPVNKMLTVGSLVSLTAAVNASPTVTATWKKNNAAVTTGGSTGLTNTVTPVASPQGATLSLVFASVALTHAGAWSVEVKNASGKTTSSIVQVGVVDNTPVTLGAAADGTVSLTVKAAGNGLGYQWLKGGILLSNSTDGLITGTATNKLTLKGLTGLDSGIYSCIVTQTTAAGILTATGATTTLNVESSVPVVTTTSLPGATVGQIISFTPAATGHPTKWFATGLPTGLVIDANTGVISGKPQVAITTAQTINFTLSAQNLIGKGPPRQVSMLLNPLPAGAVKSFVGLIARDSVVNNSVGARFQLTVANTAAYTGSLNQGGVTTALTGSVTYDSGTGGVSFVQNIPAKGGLPASVLTISIDPALQEITGNATDGGINTATLTAWRTDLWASNPQPNKAGYYTFNISADGDGAQPQGNGFGRFTLAADGTYSIVGKAADGAAFTTDGVMGPLDQIDFYTGLYAVPGSIYGSMTLTENAFTDPGTSAVDYNRNTIFGRVSWFKPNQGSNTDRSYHDGFDGGAGTGPGNQPLRAQGGRYLPPQTGGNFMDLPTTQNNARFVFTLSTLQRPRPVITDEPNSVQPTINGSTVTMPNGTSNPTKTTLTVNPTTGEFNGTFEISSDIDPTDEAGIRTVTRTVSFQGILVIRGRLGSTEPTAPLWRGIGCFNLPKLPQNGLPPTTVLTSPLDSGLVELRRGTGPS